MKGACKLSQIAEEFDNASSDHATPVVELEWEGEAQVSQRSTTPSTPYDAAAISPEVVTGILQSYEPGAVA